MTKMNTHIQLIVIRVYGAVRQNLHVDIIY